MSLLCSAKYESSARGSALYEMHELRGVGLDMSMVSSNRLTFNDTDSMIRRAEENKLSGGRQGTAGMTATMGAPAAMLGSIPTAVPHLHSAPPASVATVGVPAVPTATPRQQVVGVGATSAAQEEQLFRLSRLILAEEQIRSTSKGIAAAHDRVSSGADIISSCITESILNKAYRIQQQSSNRVDPDKIV